VAEPGGVWLDKEAQAAWQRRADAVAGESLPVISVDGPGHEILREKATPVRHANRRLRELIGRMRATMYRQKGVGLAAPQVGVSQRVIVADAGDRHCALLNPEIVAAEGSQIEPMEGCLSIPDLAGEVERAEHVRVHGRDPDGREVWIDASGYFARVLQHEIDHLNGVLFTDRARRIVRVEPETKLRVVFMGTSEFGAEVLRVALNGGVTPELVVTAPDRPGGRGLRLRPSPVHALADEVGCEVLTPARGRDAALQAALAASPPDVLVTAAYGQILPERLLALPRLGAVNVHPSALPRYRGPDPIRRALWNGEAATAVTIQLMSKEVDAGDILAQEPVDIGPEEDGGALSARLAGIGGRLLLTVLRGLATGRAEASPQAHAQATYAAKIRADLELVDFRAPAAEIAAHVRALAPRPGLRTAAGLKILGAVAIAGEPAGVPPGGVVWIRPEQGIAVATGEGLLVLRGVQPPGGRAMDAGAYANGHRLARGETLQ